MIDSAPSIERFGSDLTSALLATLAGGLDAESLALAVTECAAAADLLFCKRPIACTAGCPHCCVLNVSILLPEGMIIANWLRERYPQPELDTVRDRIAAHCRRIRWMEDDERITKQVACPLLDADGNCTIHPVRPLVCRAVASLDRTSCREAFSPIITDEKRLVSADLLRQALFEEAFMALARSFRHCGLDDRSIELGSGVLAFLEHPELQGRLISGEQLPADLWQ
jgi:Fe-S-cluster containining protein